MIPFELSEHPKTTTLSLKKSVTRVIQGPLEDAFEAIEQEPEHSIELTSFSGATPNLVTQKKGFITHLVIPQGFDTVRFNDITGFSEAKGTPLEKDVALNLFVPYGSHEQSMFIHDELSCGYNFIGSGGHSACCPGTTLRDFPRLFKCNGTDKDPVEITILNEVTIIGGDGSLAKISTLIPIKKVELFFLMVLLPSLTWCYIAFDTIEAANTFYFSVEAGKWKNIGTPVWHEKWRSLVAYQPN